MVDILFTKNRSYIRSISWLFALIIAASLPLAAQERCVPTKEPLNIWLFSPSDNHNQFWRTSGQFAKAVASDLHLKLRIITIKEYSDNRFGYEELVKNSLDNKNTPHPDFIISVLYGGGEFSQISLLHSYGIPFITYNTSLDENVLKLTGEPRTQFKFWKAHISPNEKLAGEQLVTSLSSLNTSKTMAFIAGPTRSTVNKHRVGGAMFMAEQLSLDIVPPVYTDWSKNNSINATQILLHRISDIDFLWTAGPEIADGAIEVLTQSNSDVTVGSFDWSQSNIEHIRSGRLAMSFGGHFMEAGWATLMIYDYLHGLDFIDDTGSMITTKLEILNSENISQIAPLILGEKWQNVDFTKRSKCINNTLKNYDFSLRH